MRKYLIAVLVLFNYNNLKAQWLPLNSTTTNVIMSINFVNDSLGYFADESQRVYKTEDGGLNWNLSDDSLGRTVHFLSVDTGFVAYNNIYRTVNGGNTWTEVFQSTEFINTFCFTNNGNTGYASANSFDSMFVYKSIDRGNTWNLITALPFVFGPIENTGITFTSPDTGYLCGDGIY